MKNNTPFTFTFTGLPPMPVESKPLRLEAGKSYVNRQGQVVGPMIDEGEHLQWRFKAEGSRDIFKQSGGYDLFGKPHWKDLIREHVPSEPAKEDRAKVVPKVGDRLCCVKEHPEYRWFAEEKVIVSKVDEDSIETECGHIISISDLWNTGHFEIISPFPPDPSESQLVAEKGEEEKAREALEDGWLWFGKGPLNNLYGGVSGNVMVYDFLSGKWRLENSGAGKSEFYALRAGSEIARKNGLEPENYILGGFDLAAPGGDRTVYPYPPAESEWPEKPDAGEGIVWERQEPTRVQSINEGRFILLSHDKKSWRVVEPTKHCGLIWTSRVVFRAVKDEREEAACDEWVKKNSPSGDVDSVHRQWRESSDYADFLEEIAVPAQYRELGEDAKARPQPHDGPLPGAHPLTPAGFVAWDFRKGGMNFIEAVKCLANGHCISRKFWGTTYKIEPRGNDILGSFSVEDMAASDWVCGPLSRIQAPEPVVEADPEFPPVGAKLRFTKDQYDFTAAMVGDVVEVTFVNELCFHTTTTNGDDVWVFRAKWRDGLELVTVDPVSGVTVPQEIEIPDGFPPLIVPEGKRAIIHGFGWNPGVAADFLLCWKKASQWYSHYDRTPAGALDNFYVELVDEAPADERKPREWVIKTFTDGTQVIHGSGPELAHGEKVRVREILTGKESL